jgi:hypothetical protein
MTLLLLYAPWYRGTLVAWRFYVAVQVKETMTRARDLRPVMPDLCAK